jgi:hypothetical protein
LVVEKGTDSLFPVAAKSKRPAGSPAARAAAAAAAARFALPFALPFLRAQPAMADAPPPCYALELAAPPRGVLRRILTPRQRHAGVRAPAERQPALRERALARRRRHAAERQRRT